MRTSVPSNLIPTRVTELPEYEGTSVYGWSTYSIDGHLYKAQLLGLVSLAFVPSTRTVNTGSGLLGGGKLDHDLTLHADFSDTNAAPLGTASPGFGDKVARGDHVHPALDLANLPETQGVLPLGRGGTGAALSPSPGAVAYSGVTAMAFGPVGAANSFLISGGTGGPLWVPQSTLTPLAAGAATPGVSLSPARADHVHPVPDLSGLTGVLPVTKGGTGASSLTGYVKGSGTTPLTASATIPASDIGGTLPPNHGGTGINLYTPGDLIYASGTTTLDKLPDVAEGKALISGGVGLPPEWDKINLAEHVIGVLPPENGGTGGSVTQVAGTVSYSNGTGYALTAVGVSGQFLVSGGAGAPTWIGFSAANPAPLGTPSPGVSPNPARADHVHQSVVIGGGISGTMADFNTALTDGDFVFQNQNANLKNIVTGAGAVGDDVSIELGQLRTGSGNSYIDFHSVAGSDNDARLLRSAGVDGGFGISNNGLGTFGLTQTGAAPLVFSTNSLERMRIAAGGGVGIGIGAPVAKLHVTVPDGNYALGLNAATKGIRFIVSAGGSAIHGVDNTLNATYQPLYIGGSDVGLEVNGVMRVRCTPAGDVQVTGPLYNLTGVSVLDGPLNNGKYEYYRTAGVDRWVGGIDAAVESGGNAGANWFLNRYADNGTFLGTPFSISRATGLVTTASLQVNGSFWSTAEIRTNQAGVGNVSLTPGAPDHSGYVSLWHPNNTRAGYVGFISTPSGGDLNYQNENGGRHNFGQSMTVGGQDIWVNGVNTGLLLQRVSGADSFIRSYSGNLYLGYNNTNSVLINSAGLRLDTGQFIGNDASGNQMLLHAGSTNTPTTIFRNDGNSFYLLLSDPSIYPQGGWNTLRPFSINLGNGSTSIANGLTVNGGFTVGSDATFLSTITSADYINMIDRNNDLDVNIRFLDAAGTTYRGIIGFQGSADLRLWSNTGWVRSVSNFVAPYIQSDGGMSSAGIVSSVATGLSAGFRAVNNNIGHDYRFVAKDAGPFAITNESLAIEYMNFDTAGNINMSRPTAHTSSMTFTSTAQFNSLSRNLSGGGIVWANAWACLECYNNDAGGGGFAGMKFHRPGQFGVYYGLDPDNCVRLGGWSAGILTTVDPSGNFTAAGNNAAYSDERLKTNWRDVQPDFVAKLAEVKHGIYDRTDAELTQVGVGAQSLQKLLPEAIGEANGHLTVNYGNAAMLSAVELAKMVVSLEKRIAELEEKLNAH